MNAFDLRYAELMEDVSVVGWDGHNAPPVTKRVWDNVKSLWEQYKLDNKTVELSPDTTGVVHIAIKSFHGNLQLAVDSHGYGISIYQGLRVILPYVERTL